MRRLSPSLFLVKKTLGPLENEVMDIVWKKDSSRVREIVEVLRNKRPIAYTTVMTIMDNLYKKGFLIRKKIKKSYYYSPAIKKDYAVSLCLARIFQDLSLEYGKKRIFYLAVTSSIFPKIKIAIITPYSRNVIRAYQLPVVYGISLVFFLTLFSLSMFDLIENLRFFGALDYLKLLSSESGFAINKLYLITMAFFENLPVVNITTTIASFILIGVLLKKLLRLFKFKNTPIKFIGGAL
ncbi:MAG: BlaI/MecI/CopY family transcriptional regulator [bacterium]|nr:BlaI/MecI/CopY family transcriptional regulator [bacterium]